jgi:hypothetical protein
MDRQTKDLLTRVTAYWRRVQIASALESLKDERTDDDDVIRATFTYEQFLAGEAPLSLVRRAFKRLDDQREAARAQSNNPIVEPEPPVEYVDVLFSPFGIRKQGERFAVNILFGAAKVNRDGNMFTADVESEIPPIWIGRAFLGPTDHDDDGVFPLADADVYYDAIEGALRDLETWPLEWSPLLAKMDAIWRSIPSTIPVPLYDHLKEKGYDVLPGWMRFEEHDSKKLTIIRVYEKLLEQIRNDRVPAPYGELFTGKHRQVLSANPALHLGQMGGKYPLKDSQRRALLAFLSSGEGHITAVNGPPGTGKTTLLQSVIASEMVRCAVRGKEPPLFVACAATNQAVANIIDAFKKATVDLTHPLADRWIPGLGRRYGIYFRGSKGESLRLAQGSIVGIPSNFRNQREEDDDGVKRLIDEVERRNQADPPVEVPIEILLAISESQAVEQRFLATASKHLKSDEPLSLEQCTSRLRDKVLSCVGHIQRYAAEVGRMQGFIGEFASGQDCTLGELKDLFLREIEEASLNLEAVTQQHEAQRKTEAADEQAKRLGEDVSLRAFSDELHAAESPRRKEDESNIDALVKALTLIAELKTTTRALLGPTTFWGWLLELLPWKRNSLSIQLRDIIEDMEQRGLPACEDTTLAGMRAWVTAFLNKRQSYKAQRTAIESGAKSRHDEITKRISVRQGEVASARQVRDSEIAAREAKRTIALAIAKRAVAFANEKRQRFLERLNEVGEALDESGVSASLLSLKPADLDGVVDCNLRLEAFLWATHYWEARFLKEVHESGWRDQGRRERAFRMIGMLTPCFVSTFDKMGLSFNRMVAGKVVNPLWEFADTLIVDEAGQASPDKGAFAFAFAKRAIVLGDVHQLPPVESGDADAFGPSIARSFRLLEHADIAERGMLSGQIGLQKFMGSVMRLANASARFDMSKTARGMWLREHFRCDNRIVEFSNHIWYTGDTALIPCKGVQDKIPIIVGGVKTEKDRILPPVGHIDVYGTRLNNRNIAEAHAIVNWLNAIGPELQRFYHKDINEIVAVVTPFRNQRKELRGHLKDRRAWHRDLRGIEKMTVGTVHALQGAEKPVILFSTVYDKPAPNYFFDRQHTLLNVAVTRAMDSFIVVGNPDLFKAATAKDFKKPSTYLRDHLFTHGPVRGPHREGISIGMHPHEFLKRQPT